MQTSKASEKGQWMNRSTTPAYTSWCGYAFENICFVHEQQIRTALQIAGIQSFARSSQRAGNQGRDGAQIDLLIDRADQCINTCQMKFSFAEFTITKKYAAELKQKLAVFNESTKTRKVLFLTNYNLGVAKNIHYIGLVHNQLTMDAFFKEG